MTTRSAAPRGHARAGLIAIGVGLALLVPVLPTSAHGQAIDPGLVEEIESVARSVADSVPYPGLVVGVVVGDSLAFDMGHGVADRATGEPVDSRTLFQIGSVSKSFTASMAAMLADRGAIAWTDPISQHYPPSAELPEEPITLAQVAAHTSGLPGNAPTLRRKHGDYPILAFTHFELYRSLAESELSFEPGTDWGYSNFGYAVLGHVLELRSGEPYETLLKRELLDPIGMASTTVTIWPELADRLATPYIPDDETGALVEYTPWDEEALAPAGGIASTLEDMGRWIAFQIRARAGLEERLSRAAAEGLQRPGWTFPSGNAYGMGWFVESPEGVGEVVSVGGEVDGYTADVVFAPDRGVGVVAMTNRGNATGLPDLTRWVLARVAGAEPEALYRRGLLHQAAREWSAAIEAFEQVVERTPPGARALYQIGRTGAISGSDLDVASAALERYLEIDPPPGDFPHAAARWRLGMVHQRAGRCEDAEREYRAAIEADPDYESAVASA
ncbi:MAG: serine hydrolase, partial [Gemmatimonadota bacterium]|nr:serine hydrolase [Gemmatimonadota bacterium]